MSFQMDAAAIKAKARELGFDLCGIARAERHPKLARLADWIDGGYAGDMTYLARSCDERLEPVRRAAARPIDHQPGGRLQH